MYIHTFQRQDGQKRHLLLDDNEAIVDLPTRFAFSCANKPRYSIRTPQEYLKALKYFCEYLQTCYFGSVSTLDEIIAAIGPASIEDWLIQQRNGGIEGSTLRFRDAVLKMFMYWLTTQDAGQVRKPINNPYADGRLKTAAPNRKASKYITFKEVSTFIKHGFYNESERCMAHFIFDTGLRASEVARVRHRDLPNIQDYPDNVMYFALRVHGSKGRGGHIKERFTIISRPVLERTLKLHSNWRVYLHAQIRYKAEEMPVFLNVQGGAINTSAIQKQFQIASQRLNNLRLISKKISPHSLRHGTAFSILQSEHGREFLENLVVCQRALGHNSIKTTEVYTMIPAPVIAQIQEQNSPKKVRERYHEAEYIYEHTFKPQNAHSERRGHTNRFHNKKR